MIRKFLQEKIVIITTKIIPIPFIHKSVTRISFFISKTIRPLSNTIGAYESTIAFHDAFNSSLVLPHRVMSFGKETCCIGALVTSYFA
jgi:hypothetical protein